MRLKDKVALVTGGSNGIGKETAILFAKEGAKVVLADINEEAANAVVEELADFPVAFIKTDVSKAADCEAMVAFAEKEFGALHILFNNAGIMHSSDDNAEVTDEDVWDLTLDINAKGVFLGCKYGIPALKRAGGEGNDFTF